MIELLALLFFVVLPIAVTAGAIVMTRPLPEERAHHREARP